MIYWFTGQPGAGKTVLGTKLKDFLQTEKRNWRKDVFYIDDSDVDGDSHIAQIISNFIESKGSDVVIDILSPDRNSLNTFKQELGENIIEIYIYNSRKKNKDKIVQIEVESKNLFPMDTCSENTNQSFSKLINHLHSIEKL